ncbi:chemotaxis protein CheA [Pigmentibacter ruber]|uniref:chemotaxis protein CheA n=1 Tax=Pigmentibacter ruber TaxID=2683196 RepID=UPI00131E4A64|nr:chemotaxis protein CheA [Pigmentibacter ruber]
MSYNEEQMQEIFFQEMREVFEHIDSCILVLEKTPGDLEIIKNLFREVHTLKGSSGVFGLREIADLTHHAEDLLDRMREGKLDPTEEVFSALLRCFDRLKEMMDAAQKKQNLASFDNSDIVRQLCDFKEITGEQLQEKVAAGEVAPPPTQENIKPGECPFHISITGADQFFLTGIDPITLVLNCRDISSGTFSLFTNTARIPALTDIEPERCYFEFTFNFVSMAEFKTVQDIFEFAIGSSNVKIEMDGMAGGNKGGGAAPAPAAAAKPAPAAAPAAAAAKPAAAATPAAAKPATPAAGKPGAPAAAKQDAAHGSNDANDFVRLKKEKLDQLMNLVGELITVKNLFVHLANRLEEVLPENEITKGFKEGTGHVTRLSARLQESVMNARMVPVGSVFTKYTRLVRDVAKKLNKKVNLVIEGEETELDKTVSEAISDPIMHLIRNSIDHGIENSETRKERGKPDTGTLLLKAGYEGNNVKIVVRDDGNGIDLDRVKNKAVNLGIVTQEQADMLSKKDIIEFIFHSGFSTAAEITDVSGRGVGMDVVRNNIRKSSGSIFVDTNPGQGTEFKIILPLSLAVIEALLIGVDGETYALPQEVITETVRAEKKDVVNLNNQPSINLRGEVIPLLRLNEVVNLRASILDKFIQQEKKRLNQNEDDNSDSQSNQKEKDDGLTNPVVIVQIDGLKVGILVDVLYWQEQIMIKPLGGFLANIPVFTGACIMGNGSVVLVLEPKELYYAACHTEDKAAA